MLKFKNSEVEKRFDALVTSDRTIHKIRIYSGLLSNITPAVAEAILNDGSGLLKEKQPVKETKPAAEK